jgi:CYTH domain-containing protein
MVSAAIGAEEYYSLANNLARSEGITQASDIDLKTQEVWVGHPYVDIIDNKTSRNFEDKILKMIQVVCDRAGVHYGDRLAPNSKKRKYLVVSIDEKNFPKYQEFYVVHSYLRVDEPDLQARIRKRGQNGKWCYTHTTRRIIKGEKVETRMQITSREYSALKEHADPRRTSTFKKRRCFFYEQQYFHLDLFLQPMPQGFNSLTILETYTTNFTNDFRLPTFLKIEKEITNDQRYSLFTLSVKKDGTRSARESESDANFLLE